MTQFPTVLLIFTALTAVTIELIHGTCRFPRFLQRSDPWAGDYKDGQLIAYINPTSIKVRESFDGGSVGPLLKDCVKRESDNKFLVRLRGEEHKTKYQCLQFLKRSHNIVQIKKSAVFDRQSKSICDEDGMSIDPFPLVHLGERGNGSVTCPFQGGYNFFAYYPHPNNSLVCSNNRLLMRIESECEKGGGIVINFRQEHCVPKGLPRNPIQKAQCVAHWTQGTYTFIVLKHAEQPDRWWCMRTSDPLTHIKEAYLWMQVVCDATPMPNLEFSQNYLKLGLKKRVFSSTCADEIQVCEDAVHYCDANFNQHCALTCKTCQSEDQIGLCTFDEQYRGQWMDSGQEGDYLIDFDTYTVRGKNIGNYNCLNLEKDIYPDKRVFLETYDNGCLPRYACAEMKKVNSSVIRFRLGDRHSWPLPNVKSKKEYICKPQNFQIHTRAESKYIKERPPRLIVNTQDIKEVPCGIPAPLQNGIAFMEDGRRCGGCLYYSPVTDPTKFLIRPVNCTDVQSSDSKEPAASFDVVPIGYSCIASFNFYNGSYSVITKTATYNSGMGQYLVWTFTKSHQIKVMKASETYVYQHNQHPKSSYIVAQFSILQQDKYNCRVKIAYPTPRPNTTTTTTTTQSNLHYINHRPRTTIGPNKDDNHKGGKYTYFPGDPNGSNGKDTDKSNRTPYPSKSGNLRGANGGSSSSVFHCNVSFYVILMMTSFVNFGVIFSSLWVFSDT